MSYNMSPQASGDDITDAMNIDDNYIDMPACGIPTQLQNKELVFPYSLTRYLTVINDPNTKARIRMESLQKIEMWLVDHGTCAQSTPGIVDELQERMFNLSPGQMQQHLSGLGTLNAYVHDNLSCLVNAIYQRHKPTSPFESRVVERIRNWLPYLKLVGTKSVEGYALRSSFNSQNTQLFIIKVPRNPSDDTLVHEAVIGLYVANKMRHLLPNFMYIYGYTRCAPPVLNTNGTPLTWCTSNTEEVSYLITENIIGGRDLSQFFNDPELKLRDFQLIFLQLLNALNQSFKRYKYTHNDLHHGNVLIRKFLTKISVPYYDASSNIAGYIVSQYVPVIIDYGNSGAQVGNQLIGKFGLARVGIIPSEPFPLYDIYKLICFAYENLSVSINKVSIEGLAIRKFLSQLFDTFGNGSIVERVRVRLSNPRVDYYQAPDYLRGVMYDEYIRLLGANLPLKLLVNVNEIVLQNIYMPLYNSPIDSCDFYKFFNTETGPTNSFEYCQAVTTLKHNVTLSEDYRTRAIQWLNNRFDADLYFKEMKVSIRGDILNAELVINWLRNNNSSSQGLDVQILTSPNYIESTQLKLMTILSLRDKIFYVISIIRSLSCALAEQGTYYKYSLELQQLLNITEEWIAVFEQSRKQVEQQQREIINLQNRGYAAEFWSKEFPTLVKQIITVNVDQLRIVGELQ